MNNMNNRFQILPNKCTFCHLNVPNRLLSPKGLSALVYPMYSSLQPIFSLLFFSFASFFASLLALFSSGVSRAFINSFFFFLSSFSLRAHSWSDPELSEDSEELDRRLLLSLSLLSSILFCRSLLLSLLCCLSRSLLLLFHLSLSYSLLCPSLPKLLLSELLCFLLSRSLLSSEEYDLDLDLLFLRSWDRPLRGSASFVLLILGSSRSGLKQKICIT